MPFVFNILTPKYHTKNPSTFYLLHHTLSSALITIFNHFILGLLFIKITFILTILPSLVLKLITKVRLSCFTKLFNEFNFVSYFTRSFRFVFISIKYFFGNFQ